MPNPRNRHSRQRKRTRRGHDKVALPTLSLCKTTGETHMRHTAYKHEGDIFYRGQLLVKGKAVVEKTDDEE
ncbi:MAG: ribosomal protein [Bacteroidota bacterium]|jgi:large subunit ribosomal protein L32